MMTRERNNLISICDPNDPETGDSFDPRTHDPVIIANADLHRVYLGLVSIIINSNSFTHF